MRVLHPGFDSSAPSLLSISLLRFSGTSLLGALILSLVGCAEPPVPVATVSVALSRATVPLGGPLELAFRFDPSPEFESIDGDYRVFVHFLDDEESMMWADDHDPPVPISSWQPGQTISYSRRVTVPMYPYIGEAVVAVGLYSPTTGERLTLLGEDLGRRAYQAAVLTMTPQADSSHLVYGDGWHGVESGLGVGQQWRWTSDRSRLSFRNPGSDVRLYLELAGRPNVFEGGEQRVELRVNDALVHEILLTSADREFQELDLQAAQLGDADTVHLDFDVDPSFVPAESPDETSRDVRRLGVQVFYIFPEPR